MKACFMGLAFKPNIDDLRESPAQHIVSRVLESCNECEIFIVEPYVTEHKIFKLTDYKEAFDKADIVAILVAHNQFKDFSKDIKNKKILNFCIPEI